MMMPHTELNGVAARKRRSASPASEGYGAPALGLVQPLVGESAEPGQIVAFEIDDP